MSEETEDEVKKDFIREIIDADLASGKHSEIVTRFPRSRTVTCTLDTRSPFV